MRLNKGHVKYCIVLLSTTIALFTMPFTVMARQAKDSTAERVQKEDLYKSMRKMALEVTAKQLDLNVPTGQVKVYGLVVDWNMGKAIATIVAFSTGDANMYISTGGGIIGGVQHEAVNKAAKASVGKAQEFLHKATHTNATPLPEDGQISFFLLTNNGLFTARETVTNFYNASSIWIPLFDRVNEVIGALKAVQEAEKP